MRVLVTGATGFVGGWVVRELESAGHMTIPAPPRAQLDLTDPPAVARYLDQVQPEAAVHLAGVAYARDADRDPADALRVNEGGTRTLLETLARSSPVPVIVAGSSEVYGHPDPGALPLAETATLQPIGAYGRSKLAQERVALRVAETTRQPVAITRSFNVTGPGQRAEFVAPALARRVLQARRSGGSEIVVGNLDVRRDIGDVRDAARAFRLILEGLAGGWITAGSIFNIATGTSTAIRTVLDELCRIVGVAVAYRVDQALVRQDDPLDIVGDASKLRQATGWTPTRSLHQTLTDLVSAIGDL